MSLHQDAAAFLVWFEGFMGKQVMAEINSAELTALRRSIYKARDVERRATVSCLAQFPDVQKFIAEAAKLKNAKVREQVQEMIRCGLENADDSCSEGEYARESKANLVFFVSEHPTRAIWWRSMFFVSVASCTCDARHIIGCPLSGAAKNWLLKRGLLG